MAATTGLTIEDFERLPDALAKNRELVNGELVDVSGNTDEHNSLRDLLIALLLPHVVERKLGKIYSEQEFDFDGNVHGPDVAFIRPAKLPLRQRKRRVQDFVPDLAIEIVSANDTFDKLIEKTARYRKCGTTEVWILSQENRVAFVHTSDRREMLSDEQVFESALIPGFSIRLGDLFDRAIE
jgi:Uma2 family endonuclease